MLKYVLLGFLRYQSLTGYDLEQHIRHSTVNFWHARLSQVYMTLKELESSGLVRSDIEPQEKRPDRRIYTLTDSGLADLDAWLAEPLDERAPAKDPVLLKIFFSAPAGKNAILGQLRRQLDLHRQQYAVYTAEAHPISDELVAQQPNLATDALLWQSVREFGARYEQLYITWLEDTIKTIEIKFPETR